ncbi:hypothetical protein [uncultured Acetobacteroides sp.]|uniref:hypothetical protein n=1 Tax=uncultured Acetobacteroides sp. TaxID=1760811 RepID=UPI0029F5C995|nr:hypothetical protein [uncultured Acetobacteroides sp.]
MKTRIIFLFILLCQSAASFAQTYTDQNGLKTFITNSLGANAAVPQRYQIATVGYNSYHWQPNGMLIIELFSKYFGTGYEKYFVEIGYNQGTQGSSSVIYLADSKGVNHYAKVVLGEPYDLNSTYGGYQNKAIPVYLDVRFYSDYIAKITFQQNKVDEVSGVNQIKLVESPTPTTIPDFDISSTITTPSNMLINGNVGIGTNPSSNKLDVNGIIRAKEVKVESGWADFVFKPDYQLKPLAEVEQFITTNGHLPEVPTAKEVEQNGVSLGEMNTKLLQKVEELTLYIIKQNKVNDEQNKEIQQLKKQLNKLSTKR